MKNAIQMKRIFTGKIICIVLFVFFNLYTFFNTSVLFNHYSFQLSFENYFSYIFAAFAYLIYHANYQDYLLRKNHFQPIPHSLVLNPTSIFSVQLFLLCLTTMYCTLYFVTSPEISLIWITAQLLLFLNMILHFVSKDKMENVLFRIHTRFIQLFSYPYWLPFLFIIYSIFLQNRPEGLNADPFFPINIDRCCLILFAALSIFIEQRKEARLYQKHFLYFVNIWIQIGLYAFIHFIVTTLALPITPLVSITFLFLIFGIFLDVFILWKARHV